MYRDNNKEIKTVIPKKQKVGLSLNFSEVRLGNNAFTMFLPAKRKEGVIGSTYNSKKEGGKEIPEVMMTSRVGLSGVRATTTLQNPGGVTVGGAAAQRVDESSVILSPPIQVHAPHRSHVVVEHRTGLFLPLKIYKEMEQKELQSRRDAAGLAQSNTVAWSFHEDPAQFHSRLVRSMQFLLHLRSMIGGVACGFSLFNILDYYLPVRDATVTDVFVDRYAPGHDVLIKAYLFLSMGLLALSLCATGFDFAEFSLAARRAERGDEEEEEDELKEGRRVDALSAEGAAEGGAVYDSEAGGGTGVRFSSAVVGASNTASGSQQRRRGVRTSSKSQEAKQSKAWFSTWLASLSGGSGNGSHSPLRNVLQLHVFCYIVSFVCTIVEMALSVDDDVQHVRQLASNHSGSLIILILIRSAMLTLGWMASLWSS